MFVYDKAATARRKDGVQMIHSVEIQGYRLLDDFKADLGSLTVVIGANATGKSTLLECLKLVSQCAEFPLGEVNDWHGGLMSILNASSPIFQLGWRITFTKPKDNPFWAGAPFDANRKFVYEVGVRADHYFGPVPVFEVLRTAEPFEGHDQPFKYLDSSGTRSMIFDRQKKKLVPFDDAIPEDVDARKPDGSLKPGNGVPGPPFQSSGQTVGLRLAQMRFFNEYPELSWIRLLLSNFRTYPGFDVSKHSGLRTRPADVKRETYLHSTGENLGTVLHELLTRHDYRAYADDLRDFLRSAYPWFEEVNVETAYGVTGKVVVRVREKGAYRAMELSDLSDGMVRFLCLAAAMLNPLPPILIVLDEPEVGLHPRLLPIVADMIKLASERTQVLVTTHSPDLLNCFDLDDIAVMTRQESRAVWNRPASRDSLRKMLDAVSGDTLGDLHRSGELEAY